MEIARLQLAVDATQAKKGAKDLDILGQSAGKASKSVGLLGKAIGIAAVALAASTLASFIKASIDLADAASKAAQAAGITIEALTGLQFAAELAGVSSSQFSDSLRALNNSAVAAASGSDKQSRAFERLGVSVRGAGGEVKNADVLLKEVATSLAGYEDGAAKAALAQEIFGRSGADLLPLLNSGAEGIEELTGQAERLGLVIDQETAAAAEEFNDSLSIMGSMVRGTGNMIMADMLPTLNYFASSIIEVAEETGIATIAANIIGATLKTLASVAMGVGWAFRSLGAIISAVAEALVQLAYGDYEGAWEKIQSGALDTVEITTDSVNRLKTLWGSNAASTVESADKTSKALKQLGVEAKTVKPGKPLKALSKSLTEAERAAISNAEAIADMAEQLYQATLPAAELAERQAILKLNEYATPEQIASVRQLSAEMNKLSDAKAQQEELDRKRKEFGSDVGGAIRGNVDPLSGGAFDEQTARYEAERAAEEMRYQEQRMRLNEALELELITRQEYADMEVELAQTTADRMVQITQARNDMMMNSMANSFGEMSTNLEAFANEFGEQNSAMFKVAKASAIAQTTIQTFEAAQSSYKALAGIPVVGPSLGTAAAAAAIAGGMARVSAISSQSAPSYDGGGFTGGGARSGGLDGKGGFMAMVHPNETITDHTKGQRLPGGAGTTQNVTFVVQGTPDRRTQSQIAGKMAQEQNRSQSRFA